MSLPCSDAFFRYIKTMKGFSFDMHREQTGRSQRAFQKMGGRADRDEKSKMRSFRLESRLKVYAASAITMPPRTAEPTDFASFQEL